VAVPWLISWFFLAATVAGAGETRSWTGTWSWGSEGHPNCVLRVIDGSDAARFQIECDGGPPVHNTGRIEGEVQLREGKGLFIREEHAFRCEIAFEFGGKAAVLTQKGSDADCGLGHNVFLGGTYARKSPKRPKFSPEL
jgi:hypothetical protein